MKVPSPEYDAIVIGSGAGGLTAAVALANAGQKVLVLEQHYMSGGWTHSFVLDGYRFSPGVHYIGELSEGGMMRRVYEGLGLSGDLEFCELNPDGIDHVWTQGQRFDIPKGRETYINRLKSRFPGEATGIEAVFDTVTRIVDQLEVFQDPPTNLREGLGAAWKARTLLTTGMRNWQGFVDRHLSDPFLKTVISAIAGDSAVPPSDTAVALHSAVMGHYFDGAWYPRGGAYRIPRAYVRQLKRKGGEIRLSTRVKRILVQDGRAAGVELEDGERIGARHVVSNADAQVTFGQLLANQTLPRRIRRKLRKTKWSLSSLGLFLATDLPLHEMGFDSGNYWWYRTTDVNKPYNITSADVRRIAGAPDSQFDCAFVTATTLKDPSKRKRGHHTLEVFTFVPWEPFAEWQGHVSGEPAPLAYESLKRSLGDALLRTAENVIPGLSDHLVFEEIGTPLSNAFYCAGHHGHVYGPDKIRSQLGPMAWPTKTVVPDLYMVGASTLSHGVAGVTMSGLMAAGQILGAPFPELLNQNGPNLTTYPSDRPELWMDKLRKRRNQRATA